MKIADISIKRPVFAVMLVGALVVFGLFSYPRIGVDLFPNVEFPIVTVTVVYPGADPASVESKVADPIEEAVNTMSGIKRLRSVNLESVTQVIIEFELDVDADKAAQDIRDRISAIQRDLPAEIEPPVIQKMDLGSTPIMALAVAGDLPVRDLTKLADDMVKERVQRVPGVGSVDLVGGREREIQVRVDPAKLSGLGYTVEDVAQALRAQNLELPAGRIEVGNQELTVKTRGEVRTTAEIGNVILSGMGGAVVRVHDVAEILDTAEPARSSSSMDGKSAVALIIRKQSGTNSVEIAHRVKAEIVALTPELTKRGATISMPTDTTTFVEHSINDVKFDLVFGAFLAVVIILLFLHDLRATLISAVALPTAVIATFAFIEWMGFTFNNMTMLALSLSIGILIDDAIVVVENIHRHQMMGKTAFEAAADGTNEIAMAVIAVTASIVAVFVPVAFMKGIIGRFFYQFGLTVSFAVLMSALVSLTLTPMLASRLLKSSHGERWVVFRWIARFLDGLEARYRSILKWALDHRGVIVGLAILTMVASIAVATQVKAEFIPPEDRAEFDVRVELPTGTSLATTTTFVEAVAQDLRENGPSVTGTFVTVGGGDQGQINVGEIRVLMTKSGARDYHQFDVMAWVRQRYAGTENVIFGVVPVQAVGGGGFRSQAIQFNIRGSNLDEISKASNDLIAELKNQKGFVDLDSTYRGGKPELAIEIDRERAADLGVPVASIAIAVRALISGDKVTDFKDGLDIYDVTVELPESEKANLERLANLKVRSMTGQLVDLASVVSVVRTEGPSQIERQSRQRQSTVLANIEGISLGEATAIVDKAAARVVPASLTTDYAGQAEIMIESFGYMVVALILAIIIVYMVLGAQFDSFVHPFTIMLSLPLAIIGAFGGLYVANMTLNIFSMIGIIMLMGLVTKNGILLVEYTNQLREQGRSVYDALLEAGPVRLRPILMTTFAMIFGMLPVAMAISEGGEIRAPMAVCVIGGLITSTLLTLVVVPVVYSLMEGFTHSRPMRWAASKIFGDTQQPATATREAGDQGAKGTA